MNHAELLEHFPDVKPNGRGMVANCPACGDSGHHLSIREAEDGKTLVHCYHGCDPKDILNGVGLSMGDLYPSNGHDDKPKPKHKPSASTKRYEGDPLEWLARQHCAVPPDFIKDLPVGAQSNSVLFTFGSGLRNKVRLAGTHELFWDNDPDAKDLPCAPIWPMPWATLPSEIWLAESETDCIPLRYCGLDAYAVTKGAGTPFTYEQARNLYRRGVRRSILVYDADKAGRDGAEKQAKALAEAGIEPYVLDLAEAGLIDPLKGQKDIRDAWRTCLNRDEMRDMLSGAELHKLHIALGNVENMEFLDLSSIPEPAPLRYIVPDLIPEGFPTNLYADSGQGKSYLAMAVALALITGTPFLGRPVVSGPVLYLDWELDAQMQRRRWGEIARGAGYSNPPAGLHYRRMSKSLAEALVDILEQVTVLQPVLIIMDSLGKALGDDPLDHRQVIKLYSAMDNLGTVLLIDHQSTSGDTLYSDRREFGSSYKRHLARSSWQLQRVGDNGNVVGLVLRQKKTNFGRSCSDVHATLTFSESEGMKAVSLGLSEGVDKVSGQEFGLRASILQSLQEAPKTTLQLAEAVPGFDIGSIGNEVRALKQSGLVEVTGKEGHAPIYGPTKPANSINSTLLKEHGEYGVCAQGNAAASQAGWGEI